MKKTLSMFLAGMMCLALLAGCGRTGTTPPSAIDPEGEDWITDSYDRLDYQISTSWDSADKNDARVYTVDSKASVKVSSQEVSEEDAALSGKAILENTIVNELEQEKTINSSTHYTIGNYAAYRADYEDGTLRWNCVFVTVDSSVWSVCASVASKDYDLYADVFDQVLSSISVHAMDLATLLAEFKQDDKAADTKYTNKVVTIRAFVTGVYEETDTAASLLDRSSMAIGPNKTSTADDPDSHVIGFNILMLEEIAALKEYALGDEIELCVMVFGAEINGGVVKLSLNDCHLKGYE